VISHNLQAAADPTAARVDAERALLTLLSGMVRQPP
jgi:hypothetical protein